MFASGTKLEFWLEWNCVGISFQWWFIISYDSPFDSVLIGLRCVWDTHSFSFFFFNSLCRTHLSKRICSYETYAYFESDKQEFQLYSALVIHLCTSWCTCTINRTSSIFNMIIREKQQLFNLNKKMSNYFLCTVLNHVNACRVLILIILHELTTTIVV